MSSSVFKEYPSSLNDDGETKLNSNLVVFINKNGSVSVDPNALQDLLVNDATNTNTSVSVIRVSSPTPSLQQEFDEEDELERELAKMNTNCNDEIGKKENGKGKKDRGCVDGNGVDDADDDDDDEDDSVDDGKDHNDDSNDPEDTEDEEDNDRDDDDDNDDSDEQDDEKVIAKKVKSKTRKQKLAKLKKQLIEKIPHVSLTVENFYNPIEAKQLASDILSIAGITNPLQISVDFDFQRYVIANDHCYTPLTSPSQRHPSDSSRQPSTTSSPKLTTKTNNLLTKTNQKINNTNKVIKRKTPAKGITKKSNTNIDDLTNTIGTDNEDNEDGGGVNTASAATTTTTGDSADDGQDDAESYTSDESYESPSESENDRDSDLDFSVNDRPSKVRKFNRNRNLRQKQQQQQQAAAAISAKQNSNSKYNKKRQNASIEGIINSNDDEHRKTNKLPILNNKSHKKLLNQSQKNISLLSSASSSSSSKLSKSVTVLIPSTTSNTPITQTTINMSIKNNKTAVGRLSAGSISHSSPQMISSTTTTTQVVSATNATVSQLPSTKLIVGNGTQQKIILTKMLTPSQKSKLNYIQPLAPILSISSGPPVPALAPISIDTKQQTIGTPTTPQQQQQQQSAAAAAAAAAAAKKDKKPPAHMEALFSDMTSLFSTPDIIKKVGSGNGGSNNSITSTPNQQLFQSHTLTTSTTPSAVTIPMNKCYFMPLTPQSQKNRNLPAQISIRTHQSSHHTNSSNTNTVHITTPSSSSSSTFATEQDKEMDLIDSIVQKELKDTTPPPKQMKKQPSPMNKMIPNIVKMLEHPVDTSIILTNNQNQLLNSTPSSVISGTTINTTKTIITTTAAPSTTTTSIPFHHSITPITNHTQLLDDTSDLLESFAVGGGTDDGLTEDLLQHVAKLVEDKNLQEVIDKQVLGVTGVVTNNHLISVSTTPTTTTTTTATIIPPAVTNLLTKLSNKSPTIMTTPIRSDNVNNHLITNNITTTTPPINMPARKIITTTITPTTPSTPITPVQSTAKKEGIKIIRSDGRVITLPPIEAPTTRGAKRRAQNQPTNQDVNATPKRSSSVGSKSETTPLMNNSTAGNIAGGNHNNIPNINNKDGLVSVVLTAKERRQSVQSSVRKSVDQQTPKSKQKTSSTSSSGTTGTVTATGGVIGGAGGDYDDFDDDDDGSDGSYNSEDDPFRLWCICRQPHNNRFMICCDKCEDWFHGKCVNVTKAMGVEMEERGVEWVCPTCVKKQPSQLQQMFKKTIERQQQQNQQQTLTNQEENQFSNDASSPHHILSCIVCKRPARPSSIYCSDDCIRKHAQTTSGNISTTTTIVSTQLLSASSSTSGETFKEHHRQTSIPINQSKSNEIGGDVKNIQITKKTLPVTSSSSSSTSSKQQNSSKLSTSGSGTINTNRVDVFEPKTGRCLTGNSAPTIENLKRWLQEHPTFEIVHPGSAQAMAIKAKKQQLKNLAKSMEQDEQQNKFATAIQQSSKIQTTLKVGPTKRIVLVNPQQQKPPTSSSSAAAAAAIASSSNPSSPSLNTKNSTNPPKLITITQQQQQNITTAQKSSPAATPTVKTPTSKLISSNTSGNSTKNSTNSPANNKRKSTSGQSSSSSSASASTSSTSSTEKPQQHQQHQQNRSNLEPIRVTVQKTLREQLTIRMAEQESKSAKLTPNEIDKFSVETEREIFYMFSKDTGTKYRTKYRSLMFNIKDRKNKTLFRKICDKTCLPKQLVRMSAAELASQELAQWRENENKHQLEMIKKSELDLLACAKNYVLKTHKGEEVIESKRIDQVQLDPSISVEDVVSVLNNSTVSSTTAEQQITTQSNQSPIPLIKDTRIDSRFEKYLFTATGTIINDSIGVSVTNKSATPPLDKKKSTTSSLTTSSSSHKRSRSRSKDRDAKKSSSSSSSSSSKHKRRRSRDRSDDRSKKEANQQKDNKDKKDSIGSGSSNKRDLQNQTKKSLSSSSSLDSTTKLKSTTTTTTTTTKEPPKPKKEDNFNLIDKILEAQSTIDRILRPNDEAESTKQIDTNVNKNIAISTPTQQTPAPPPPPPPQSTMKSLTTDTKSLNKSMSIESSDQEPTSTVTIPTPPTITDNSSSVTAGTAASTASSSLIQKITTNELIKNTNKVENDEINLTLWSGSIVMVDVATFQIHFNGLSGDCLTIINELPIELDVVGRIQPDTVWDYIGKIKKSFNKEILLLQFFADGEDDTEAYYTLYRYLSTRKRFGVIKTKSSLIKDFYILPLAAHKSLPSVLGTVDRIGFESNRKDMLLGIIVKNIAPTGVKRVISTQSSSVPVTKIARIEKPTPPIASSLSKSKISSVMAEDRYTPPLSPKIPSAVVTNTHTNTTSTSTSIQQSSSESVGKISQNIDKTIEDGDEPYSPGGSDEEIPIMSTIMKTTAPIHIVPTNPEQDEIERKMAELTRQIEAQKMVIAGMLQTENNQQQLPIGVGINEPYSPTSLLDTTNQLDETSKSAPIPALSDIAIPSNLQEILNSINKVSTATTMPSLTKQQTDTSISVTTAMVNAPPAPIISHLISDSDDDEDDEDDEDEEEEEYTPTIGGKVLSTAYGYQPSSTAVNINQTTDCNSSIDYIPSATIKNNEPSKLASLTDEELLRMVPDDDLLMNPSSISNSTGGGHNQHHQHHHYQPHQQQQQQHHQHQQQLEQNLPIQKYNPQLHNPPPPGLEDDFI